jgi:hypothetical protein
VIPLDFGPKRCDNGCLSEQKMDPRSDLGDSAMSRCGRCGGAVCVSCQTAPASGDHEIELCGPCEAEAAAEYADL